MWAPPRRPEQHRSQLVHAAEELRDGSSRGEALRGKARQQLRIGGDDGYRNIPGRALATDVTGRLVIAEQMYTVSRAGGRRRKPLIERKCIRPAARRPAACRASRRARPAHAPCRPRRTVARRAGVASPAGKSARGRTDVSTDRCREQESRRRRRWTRIQSLEASKGELVRHLPPVAQRRPAVVEGAPLDVDVIAVPGTLRPFRRHRRVQAESLVGVRGKNADQRRTLRRQQQVVTLGSERSMPASNDTCARSDPPPIVGERTKQADDLQAGSRKVLGQTLAGGRSTLAACGSSVDDSADRLEKHEEHIAPGATPERVAVRARQRAVHDRGRRQQQGDLLRRGGVASRSSRRPKGRENRLADERRGGTNAGRVGQDQRERGGCR